MNISAIDLNLLVVLHAVLTEQSVTRAAKRLHVTQSAVSNSLGKLRDVLGDPLVVRHARGVTPTPRALELLPELSHVIERITSLIEPRARFDPATPTRAFTIAC
ncbi:MAG: LysR family transcriptional regulator, partial [Polyangiaceae bacterium]